MSTNLDPLKWRRMTAGGIPYKLKEGYPKGSLAEEDGSVQEVYIIPTSRLMDFLLESFSELSVVPGQLWYHRAARHCPGLPMMVTKKVSFAPFDESRPIDPFGGDDLNYPPENIYRPRTHTPANTYGDFVEVTIDYGGGKNDDKDNDLLELSCNATGEYILFPTTPKFKTENIDITSMGRGVLPGAGGQQQVPVPMEGLNIPCTKVIPGLEWSLKFKRVPRSALPDSLNMARALLGTVNSDPMPILMNYYAETLLFTGFSFSTKWTWRDKEPFAELELKLLEKMVVEGGKVFGHNHFFVPNVKDNHDGTKPSNWQKIVRPDGNYVYAQQDLNQLFYGWSGNPGPGDTGPAPALPGA